MAHLEDMRLPAAAREALVDDPEFLRNLVEAALNRFLDAEISEHLQAKPYERAEERRGYRNGYRSRQLKTRVGTLTLAVPMDRDGTFKSELFERYQRSEKALVGTLMEMYLEGVSTRKVRDVTEVLCGTSFSKSTVSRLVGGLDGDLTAWRERPLDVAYPYLVVDARYEHVRQGGFDPAGESITSVRLTLKKYAVVLAAASLLAACSSPVVSQTWIGTSLSGSVSQDLSLELNLSGQRAWGEYRVGSSAGSLRGTVEGDALSATLTAGPECSYAFEGSLSDSSLTGTFSRDACVGGASGSWDLALR